MLEDFRDRGIYLTEDEYRTGLRTLFPAEYQELSDEELEDIRYERIATMHPTEAEGFFNSIGDFFKNQVAPVAIAALPAITSAVGAAYGGPAGGAVGNALGSFASNAISGAAHIKPNPIAANISQSVSSFAGGNIQGAIPGLVNASKDIGNAIKPGSGSRVAGVVSSLGQAATSIAGGNYQGAVSNVINAGKDIGNAISPNAGNTVAQIGQAASGVLAATGVLGNQNQAPASTQLLSFLKSAPFMQSLLSTIATGNAGTGLQIPSEDGSFTDTSYVEMLEGLKYLTENALMEADNLGFSSRLNIESEADGEAYIEGLIESVNNYENSLLPNYDSIPYN